MIHTSNTFKSIKKRQMGPNRIFLGVYILLSAGGCPGTDKTSLLCSSNSNPVMQKKEQEGLKEDQDNASDIKPLLGQGKLLNLHGYQCGPFIASETQEAFLIKLPSEGGWMPLVAQPQQGDQTDILAVQYDSIKEPRIIKVDDRLLYLLLGQPLGQLSNIGQCSIEKDTSWHKIALSYKKPIGGPIFMEDGIKPSMQFTKELSQKLSRTNRFMSSTLSMRCVASTTLKNLEKAGFLLVKDERGLFNLVKNMLEGGAQWGTKAAVAATKDYITCPAILMGDVLQFDLRDLKLKLQASSLRLEDYSSAYYYFEDGEYDRLITLGEIKYLKDSEEEKCMKKEGKTIPLPIQEEKTVVKTKTGVTEGPVNSKPELPEQEDVRTVTEDPVNSNPELPEQEDESTVPEDPVNSNPDLPEQEDESTVPEDPVNSNPDLPEQNEENEVFIRMLMEKLKGEDKGNPLTDRSLKEGLQKEKKFAKYQNESRNIVKPFRDPLYIPSAEERKVYYKTGMTLDQMIANRRKEKNEKK